MDGSPYEIRDGLRRAGAARIETVQVSLTEIRVPGARDPGGDISGAHNPGARVPGARATGTGGTALTPEDAFDLIQGCLRDEPDSWNELHARYDGKLIGWARTFRLSPDLILDVVQEFWCHLLTNADKVLGRYQPRETASFDTWLGVVFRRFLLNQLGRQQRRTRPILGEPWDAMANDVPAVVSNPLVLLAILEAFSILTGKEQRLVSLWAAGFPHREIGRRLRISEINSATTLNRIRNKLRALSDPAL